MNNEPAFPTIFPVNEKYYSFNSFCLTKLEYFAAMALSGMCNNPAISISLRASNAFDQAEAMLKESEKRNK